MRRMNSILLGHQGASLRTDCMTLRWRVASPDRPTTAADARCGSALDAIDAGTSRPLATSRRALSAASRAPDRSESAANECRASDRATPRSCGCSPSISALHRREIATRDRADRRTELHEQVALAGTTGTHRCASFAGCPGLEPNQADCRRRRRVEMRRKRTSVARPQLPDLPHSSPTIVAGQTKPPRLGPSGPRITGMSPVKSMAPMA